MRSGLRRNGRAWASWAKTNSEEAKNLAKFVEKERVSDRFIVMGDFNSLPGSPVHKYLTEECGYTDALAGVHGLTIEASTRWATAGFMALRMHLDHIFGGPGMKWRTDAESHDFGQRGRHAFMVCRITSTLYRASVEVIRLVNHGKAGRHHERWFAREASERGPADGARRT